MPGPYLFLGQHVAWDDFVNIPSIWVMFPEKILFTGPSRNDYIKELLPKHPTVSAVGDGVINALLGLLFFPVYRTWTVKDPSAEELQKMQEHNKASLEHVVRAYQKGINIAIMPEGTSKTDGRIARIRSGAYTYATSTELKPWCIPFGNTYDYFAGKKPHVFVRFGEPYQHVQVPREGEESDEEYKKRDMSVFNGRIKSAFIDLNTITATQLTAAVLYHALAEEKDLKLSELLSLVEDLAEEYNTRHVFTAPRLDNFHEVYQPMERLLTALVAQGYVTVDSTHHIHINRERALYEPKRVESYKKGNLLLYQYHKFREVAEARPQVAAVLEGRLGTVPNY